MAGWEHGPQEEVNQLADGLVHNIDPVREREVTAAFIPLLGSGVDPCQLLIFLNVATAKDDGME
jgi:hypothetical protein